MKLRTGKYRYKFINADKVMNLIFNSTVTVLAAYGLFELILKANGY